MSLKLSYLYTTHLTNEECCQIPSFLIKGPASKERWGKILFYADKYDIEMNNENNFSLFILSFQKNCFNFLNYFQKNKTERNEKSILFTFRLRNRQIRLQVIPWRTSRPIPEI